MKLNQDLLNIYVFDRDLNIIGILDVFKSLSWIRKYQRVGRFELHCVATEENIKMLQIGNIIMKNDDDAEVAYIETVQMSVNKDGLELMQVNGNMASNLLSLRINWGRMTWDGSVEGLIRHLIGTNVSNPKLEQRKLSNFSLGATKGFDTRVVYQNSFGNILDLVCNLCDTHNLGFRTLLSLKNRLLIFDLYQGVDRTLNNGKVAPVIFSRSFENILEQHYTHSKSNLKNVAFVAGQGQGDNRVTIATGDAEGYDRRELYVDARDLSNMETEGDVEKPIDPLIYLMMLIQRGDEKLEDCLEITTFDSKINVTGNNKYKVDFNLGDKVTILDKSWGIQLDSVISEIEEVYEEDGFKINVTFGNNIPTILDKIEEVNV